MTIIKKRKLSGNKKNENESKNRGNTETFNN